MWDNELSQSKALFAKENPNIYKEDLIDVQWAHVDLGTLYMKHTSKDLSLEEITSRMQQLSLFCQSLQSKSRTVSVFFSLFVQL